MKAWQLKSEGSAFALHATGLDEVSPGPGELRVRVRACSLNYRDLTLARGGSNQKKLDGRVPLSDGAGEVDAVGAGVTKFRIGDRVAGCFFRDWQEGPFDLRYHDAALGGSVPGMLAEHVVLPEHAWVRTPRDWSFEEAACLPCAAVTVWQALVGRGRLRPGQTVLCLGTGGVSLFGLQIASALGARVIITSSSDEKLERARTLGAWGTVNYLKNPDWDKEVWSLTGKRGVDQVLEVGGPGTLDKSLKSAAAGAHVALIGVLTGFGAPSGSLFPLVARNATLAGIYVGSKSDFEALNTWLERQAIRPVIDRRFDFKDVPAAYDYLSSGKHFGKVTVKF